jgi:hypothetical protein
MAGTSASFLIAEADSGQVPGNWSNFSLSTEFPRSQLSAEAGDAWRAARAISFRRGPAQSFGRPCRLQTPPAISCGSAGSAARTTIPASPPLRFSGDGRPRGRWELRHTPKAAGPVVSQVARELRPARLRFGRYALDERIFEGGRDGSPPVLARIGTIAGLVSNACRYRVIQKADRPVSSAAVVGG